ncbi:MAG: serine hydrolase domain-containing protein [Bacteroidota bacterium]
MKKIIWLFLFPAFCYSQGMELKIDEYIAPFVDNHCFSGCILIARGNDIMIEKCYGKANYEHDVENSLNTKFRIASLTKSITQIAIDILESQGKIKKTDYLSKYYNGIKNAEKITIDHLLNHRSGITHINDYYNYDALAKEFYTIDEIIALFKDKPLDFEPGEKRSYSNSGYVMLAYIIEKTSGLSYMDYLSKYVFEPANMTSTFMENQQDVVKHKAYGYQPSADGSGLKKSLHWNPDIKLAGGSLTSTPRDIFKFFRTYFTGRLNIEPELPDKKDAIYYFQGRSPGYAAFSKIYFENNTYVVVLSNNYSRAAWNIGKNIGDIFNGKDLRFEFPKKETMEDPERFLGYHHAVDFNWKFWLAKDENNNFSVATDSNGKPDKARMGPAYYIGNNTFYLPSFVASIKFNSITTEKGNIEWENF